MVDYLGQIAQFEAELKKTPYNKRTQHHIGLVKAKIARLREAQERRVSSKGGGHGYAVRKSGDATVVLLGYPSVGKSTLLNKLTNANSPVGAYAFTTLTVIPGLMEYKHAKIQILDVPGVVRGAASGRGRGKEVLAIIRNADLIIILVDVNSPEQNGIILKEIGDSNVRINQEPPDVKIRKLPYGGIRVGTTARLTNIDTDTIKGIMAEFRMNNADVLVRENVTIDRFIDAIEGNKHYIPAITVVNKIDMATADQARKVQARIKPDIMISAEKQVHIEELKELIHERLNFMRLYLKEPGKEADMEVPMIIRKGSTIRNVCEKLHRDFVTKFKFARVWGRSVKFAGQKLLKLDHRLADNDILELHLK
jgi:small GTP-binding protein